MNMKSFLTFGFTAFVYTTAIVYDYATLGQLGLALAAQWVVHMAMFAVCGAHLSRWEHVREMITAGVIVGAIVIATFNPALSLAYIATASVALAAHTKNDFENMLIVYQMLAWRR